MRLSGAKDTIADEQRRKQPPKSARDGSAPKAATPKAPEGGCHDGNNVARKCGNLVKALAHPEHGVPETLKIWNNISISELPWKGATPPCISKKVQPNDQQSAAHEYLRDPRNISGARYHMVVTMSDCCLLLCLQADPKSDSTPFKGLR